MNEANNFLESLGVEERFVKGVKASEILKIKDVSYDDLKGFLNLNDYEDFVKNQIETMIKYEIFIVRENKQIEKFKKLEHMYIPENINYDEIKGISNIDVYKRQDYIRSIFYKFFFINSKFLTISLILF